MSKEELRSVLEELHAIRVFMVSSDQVERVRILGDLLQKALVQNDDLAADMKALIGTIHHDLLWLRQHVAKLSKQLETIAAKNKE